MAITTRSSISVNPFRFNCVPPRIIGTFHLCAGHLSISLMALYR
jgi:hypothetical protein